jgi:small multidrug resistance family-3 protein
VTWRTVDGFTIYFLRALSLFTKWRRFATIIDTSNHSEQHYRERLKTMQEASQDNTTETFAWTAAKIETMEEASQDKTEEIFAWTAQTIVQAIALFVVSGIFEIGGGWLVWKAVRENKPWWWALIGSCVLVVYGFLPTLQPMDSFGRIYAIYGGFFIFLSFLAGWGLDGERPDKGDVVGGTVSLAGVFLILFWPR